MKIAKWVSRFWKVPSYSAYLFIAPVFILLLVFTIIPLMSSFVLSMTDLNLFLTKINWVGFQNFIDAFHDERFVNSLKISFEFAALAVPLRILVSLFVAVLLARNSVFNKMMRTVYFLPVVCSATVIGIMWKITLNGYVGLIPYWCSLIGLPRLDVFRETSLALPAIGFMSIWGSFGMTAIIFLAAMKSVPNELYESAELEGATKSRQFLNITLPGIMPTFWFLLITNVIGSLQVFDLIYVVTNGGPQYATETTVAYIYYSFSTQYKAGYASAMAELFFFIIMALTVIMYMLMIRQEKE